jgi:hypothetical protein
MKKLLLICGFAAFVGSGIALATTSPQTPMPNANYQVLNSDQRIVTSSGATFTAPRTLTLPYAAGTNTTTAVIFYDVGNAVSSTNTLTITPQSGDTINGSSSSVVINYAGAQVTMYPMSGTNWFLKSEVTSGQVPGTTTNDNAATGNIGEVQTTNVTLANAKQITTNSSITLGSVPLTAGDWDCRATAAQQLSNTTTATKFSASLVTTDGVLGTEGTDGTTSVVPVSAGSGGNDLKLGPARFSLASLTTIFLVDGATFATSQLWAYGSATCRRVR